MEMIHQNSENSHPMPELGGSLEGIGLAQILRFLHDQGKSGLLLLSHGNSTAEILIDQGSVVAASFESEQGLAALDGALLLLPNGHFSFTSDRPAGPRNIDLPSDELETYLEQRASLQADMAQDLPPLDAIPDIVKSTGELGEISLDGAMVETLLAIDGSRSISELAAGSSLASTLMAIVRLREYELITIGTPEVEVALAKKEEDRPRDRVLLVEDDPDTLDFYADVLTDAGYEISTSDSGIGARGLVLRFRPCAVILDLGLPYRPGTSLLSELKS